MENEINSEGVAQETMASTLTNLLVQAEHDKSKTSKEALIEIIDKHGVDFDPKYLWD